MSIFSTILEKLGMKKAEAAPAPAPTVTAPAATAPPVAAAPTAAALATAEPAAPAPIAMVDVVSQLEALAKKHPEKLNWRASIVDLMKLLGMDSSLANRKALAEELHCPVEKMGDSAQMNMWLHKNVLGHVAANGGNVPKELLD